MGHRDAAKRHKKITLTIGIPASGKSTWTKQHIAKNPNTVRVSRDEFRFMLRDTPVTEPKIEDMITELVILTITKALLRGCDVIVDATNLKIRYIRAFIDTFKYDADIEFMVFDIPLEKCIERDKNRERPVGEHVIRKMYKDYKNLVDSFPLDRVSKLPTWKKRFVPIEKKNNQLEDCVIFDIDGTLAIMNNRGPYDWDIVDRDDVNLVVHEQIALHKSLGRKIIIFTGRDEESREKTESWLKFYDIEYDFLYMRQDGDSRKDNAVKKELFETYVENKYHPVCCYDDRLQVVQMWYELGLFCFNVNQGMHEF